LIREGTYVRENDGREVSRINQNKLGLESGLARLSDRSTRPILIQRLKMRGQ
jgi:hypothetical protein